MIRLNRAVGMVTMIDEIRRGLEIIDEKDKIKEKEDKVRRIGRLKIGVGYYHYGKDVFEIRWPINFRDSILSVGRAKGVGKGVIGPEIDYLFIGDGPKGSQK